MNKITLLFASIMLPALIQSAYALERTYSLPLSKPGEPATLNAEIHTGAIFIEGYDGTEVKVSAKIEEFTDTDAHKPHRQHDNYRRVNKSKPRSAEGLKSVKNNMMQLSIEEEDNEIDISSEYSTQKVVLHIQVPKTTRLDIELYQGGDLEINNIAGAIEASAFKGNIIANDVSGPMVAETHSTDIVVSFDKLAQENPTSLTTHSGNIDISVSKNTSARINVQNYKGEILSGLATDFVVSEDATRVNKDGKQKIVIGGMMSAEVNGGGQDITLATYNGNVYVRRK